MNLNFIFKSPEHIRYKNGEESEGNPFIKAQRAIKVEPNSNGGEGYTVTVFNLQEIHSLGENNILIAPKQMKIIEQSTNIIGLRGFGEDAIGQSSSGYGLTIIYKENKEIETCILHLYDEGVNIEYWKEEMVNPK